MPNRLVESVTQTHLACRNLPPEVYVAFANPDEVMPDKVIVAESRSGEAAERASAYNYRLAACENSMNPDAIK